MSDPAKRGGSQPRKPESVGLPPRPFLYTLDQLSTILAVSDVPLRRDYVWYEGRQVGSQDLDKLRAINIAPPNKRPEWRVSEQELVRWMKRKRFRHYERAWME